MEKLQKHRMLLIGICLMAILVVSFWARAGHFRMLFPYFLYQDEVRQAEMSLKVIREKTLEPEFYLYPHFPVYFNSAAYFVMFAAKNARELIGQRSLDPVVEAAKKFDAASWESIFLQRAIAMALGIFCVFGVWLLARMFMSEGFSLFACLIYGLLPLPLSFSHIAKNDIYLECSAVYSFFFMFRLIKSGNLRDYLVSALFVALCLDSKLDFFPAISLLLATMIRAANEKQAIEDWLFDKRLWLTGVFGAASMFIFSPYYYLRFDKALEMIGWVYYMSGVNSYSHIDYHHWWLDRYYYPLLVILPFLCGLPAYIAGLAGILERSFRLEFDSWFVMTANIIAFIYAYLSQSGGSFPMYHFMHMMPFFAVFAVWPLFLLWKRGSKKLSLICSALVLTGAIMNAQSYYAVNFQAFDQIGPRLVKEIPAGAKILGYSVYLPGPALARFDYKRGWPQNLDRAVVEKFNPDYILVYRSDFSGFEKFYHDTHPVNARLQELLAGKWGYQEVSRLEVRYFCDFIFKWLDPEFMIELVLLEKKN
jgi:hypothetical protein